MRIICLVKNLLIISSKKYHQKISDDNFKTVEKNNLKYDVFTSNQFKKLNDIDPDLIISLWWWYSSKSNACCIKKCCSTIGPGRLGYLVSSSEILKIFLSLENENYDVAKRKAIIQNNDSLPAFNEVVIIKNSPTGILDWNYLCMDKK